MDFFKQIQPFTDNDTVLRLQVRQHPKGLEVVYYPADINTKGPALNPLRLVGSAEELDANFFTQVGQLGQVVEGFTSNVDALKQQLSEEAAQQAKDQAKPAKTEKKAAKPAAKDKKAKPDKKAAAKAPAGEAETEPEVTEPEPLTDENESNPTPVPVAEEKQQLLFE